MAQPNPSKRRLGDDAVVDAQVDDHVIAAERVVPFSPAAAVERAEVPRVLVVVEDHGLVERLDIGGHPNISRTRVQRGRQRVDLVASRCRAPARRGRSRRRPSRCISGWQQ